ncbi:hypothetical protein Dimus_026570, partial [Dionaea muscipula]
MVEMAVDDSRALGYGALFTHIFTAIGVDLSRYLTVQPKGPICYFTIQRSEIIQRITSTPQPDDPTFATPTKPSVSSSSSALAPTPAPARSSMTFPGSYACLNPEFQSAFMNSRTDIASDFRRYVDHSISELRSDITCQLSEMRIYYDSRSGVG